MFAEYPDQDMCAKRAKAECNIASVARLDTLKYVTVAFMCDEGSMQLGNKQNRMEKKYQHMILK